MCVAKPVAAEQPRQVTFDSPEVSERRGLGWVAVEEDRVAGSAAAPDEVPRPEVAVADGVGAERVVVAAEEAEGGGDLLVREHDPVGRVSDLRVQTAPVSERLALDPREDVAALLVDAEPAGARVEARALEPEESLAHPLGVRPLRTPDGVADANDGVLRRPARQELLLAQASTPRKPGCSPRGAPRSRRSRTRDRRGAPSTPRRRPRAAAARPLPAPRSRLSHSETRGRGGSSRRRRCSPSRGRRR